MTNNDLNRRDVLTLAGGATAAVMTSTTAASAQTKPSDIVMMDGA